MQQALKQHLAPYLYRVIDMHTAGEPVRIVAEGHPALQGATILEKRRDAQARFDHVRRTLMLEPRGHAGMYGVIFTEPSAAEADLAVLFTHNSGYSTMCGHATIAIGRWAVEQRLVPVTSPTTRFVLECPCGLVTVEVAVDDAGAPQAVSFEGVPAYLESMDAEISVPGLGLVRIDIAYGGAFYAVLPASRVGHSLAASPVGQLTEIAVAITQAVRGSVTLQVAEAPDLAFLYGTILTDDAAYPGDAVTANLCVFGEGQVDRCPTGSGVAARLAIARARGHLTAGQGWRFRGPSGGVFQGGIVRDVAAADGRPAIVARVSGWAHHMGRSEIVVEADDALANGMEALSFA